MNIPEAIKKLTLDIMNLSESGKIIEAEMIHPDGRAGIINLKLKFREDYCLWFVHAHDERFQCVDVPLDMGNTAAARVIMMNLARQK